MKLEDWSILEKSINEFSFKNQVDYSSLSLVMKKELSLWDRGWTMSFCSKQAGIESAIMIEKSPAIGGIVHPPKANASTYAIFVFKKVVFRAECEIYRAYYSSAGGAMHLALQNSFKNEKNLPCGLQLMLNGAITLSEQLTKSS